MVSRQEWARMCEPYLTGDSGVFSLIEGVKSDMRDERAMAVQALCENYRLAREWAMDGKNTDEDRLGAYEVCDQILGYLAYAGINPLEIE